MRVYVPPESGLGTSEVAAMRRLSSGALSIVADELDEPRSWPTLRRILRSGDPEAALARQMSIDAERAVVAHRSAVDSGLGADEVPMPGDGLGNFFKRIGKAIKRHIKQVVHAVEKVHAKIDPIYRTVARPNPRRASPAPTPASAPSGSNSDSSATVPPSPTPYTDTSSSGSYSTSSGASSPSPTIQYVQEQPPTDSTAPAGPTAPAADATAPTAPAAPDVPPQAAPEAKSSSALFWLLLAGGGAALAARKK